MFVFNSFLENVETEIVSGALHGRYFGKDNGRSSGWDRGRVDSRSVDDEDQFPAVSNAATLSSSAYFLETTVTLGTLKKFKLITFVAVICWVVGLWDQRRFFERFLSINYIRNVLKLVKRNTNRKVIV